MKKSCFIISIVAAFFLFHEVVIMSQERVRVGWITHYFGPDSLSEPSRLILDKIGNVYVTGRSVIDEKHFIYTTLKYAQTPQVSTKERIAPVVRINQLLPNYPNPFNSSTKFKYIVSRNCQVTLKLFDLTGQEIATLVDGQQLAGEHVINWNEG